MWHRSMSHIQSTVFKTKTFFVSYTSIPFTLLTFFKLTLDFTLRNCSIASFLNSLLLLPRNPIPLAVMFVWYYIYLLIASLTLDL